MFKYKEKVGIVNPTKLIMGIYGLDTYKAV